MGKLQNFLKGIGASNELLHKAFKQNAFIEMVCLTANQIDALLRIAIILQNQLNNNNKVLIEELLFQGDGDGIIMEKRIYDLALQRLIISKPTHDRLYALYNQRNKVVHRYIISDITTQQIKNIARDFLSLRNEIKEIVREIENTQIKSGKGMTSNDPMLTPEEVQKFIEESIKDKHGALKIDIPPANGKKTNDRFYKFQD